MSVEETDRLLGHLKHLHIHVRTLIINRVIAKSKCVFCEARRTAQEQHLNEIENRFSTLNLVTIPLLPHEIRGQESLKIAQAMLHGEQCPVPSSLSTEGHSGFDQMPEKRARRVKQRLSPPQQQLILVGGKGGVGKTTVAATTAIRLARKNKGEKILLFSIDPAHSLSDSLEQEIGNRITAVAGVDGLFALEMEAPELVEELKRKYVAEIQAAFEVLSQGSYEVKFDRQVMEELFSLTPPGLDELIALLKIMDFLEEGEFDRYILDMAPTGHALRFLETPNIIRQWLIAFLRLLIKYHAVVQLPRTAELLRERSKRLRQVRQLLADTQCCGFMVVTIPEAMAVLETKRLIRRLDELSIACVGMVVNMVMPPSECPFCAAVQREQHQHLQELNTLASNPIDVPLFPCEVRGLDDLTTMGMVIYGDK